MRSIKLNNDGISRTTEVTSWMSKYNIQGAYKCHGLTETERIPSQRLAIDRNELNKG